MFLQDISQSYVEDLSHLQQMLPVFSSLLFGTYPGSVMSLATFVDYPFPDVGLASGTNPDHCFHLEVPFTSDSDKIQSAIDSIQILDGRDLAEGQLTALHHAASGGYFQNERVLPASMRDVKLLVLSTDAPFHAAGDLEKALIEDQPRLFFWKDDLVDGLENKYSVRPNDGDGVLSCSGYDMEDYPTADQVVSALQKENFIVMLLVTDDVYEEYSQWQQYLDRQGVKSILARINEDSSDILQSLDAMLSELHELVCNGDIDNNQGYPLTTTTTVAVTTAPTSTTTTTPTTTTTATKNTTTTAATPTSSTTTSSSLGAVSTSGGASFMSSTTTTTQFTLAALPIDPATTQSASETRTATTNNGTTTDGAAADDEMVATADSSTSSSSAVDPTSPVLQVYVEDDSGGAGTAVVASAVGAVVFIGALIIVAVTYLPGVLSGPSAAEAFEGASVEASENPRDTIQYVSPDMYV
eukprot:Lankesteria_metandrocarpae@DN5334_c1_g2_i1.p1